MSSRPAASSVNRAQSVGGSTRFTPTEVYVQGFYDWNTKTGEITAQQVDEYVSKLLANVPKELQDKFRVDKKYPTFRRIAFVSDTGGEICWKLREKLLESISAHPIKINGKDLRVRVQDSPEGQAKRAYFWRAVEALRKFCTEDTDFVIEPKLFAIHELADMQLMGSVSDSGYRWDDQVVKRALPSVDMAKLKRASIVTRRAS